MLFRRLAARLIDVGAAGEPCGDDPSHPRVPLDESPDVVSIAAVPLGPAVAREVSHLIQAGRIPRLGDELRAGERLLELDLPDDRRVDERRAVLAARQNRALVEAEAVDVHLLHPVPQAIDNQLLR